MLETLGVTEFTESAYRGLLASPGQTVTDLARQQERSPGAVRRAVACAPCSPPV